MMASIAARLLKRKRGPGVNPNQPSTADLEAGRCRLLELPLELQLSIYELAVLEQTPLLVNCPCNSSYRGRYDLHSIEEHAWKAKEKQPPLQPALSLTCRAIRDEVLPIFYGGNVFRACYCYPLYMMPAASRWLRMIGPENREMLRHFYFYDRNVRQDVYGNRGLEMLKNSDVVAELRGRLETMSADFCCAHLVTFGGWERKAGEVPLARVPGVPRLRLEGEI